MIIKIKKHTEGDSRVAKGLPTIQDFTTANRDHHRDVIQLGKHIIAKFRERIQHHDWTKIEEPYVSMFYRDLCAAIEGSKKFEEGEWSKLHYTDLERHHLNRYCPEDVNLIDVLEMVCDCVAAGMARSGDVSDINISEEVLKKAVNNTAKLLKDKIEVVEWHYENYGMEDE